MYHMAVRITDYLIKHKVVSMNVREEYIYGFEILTGKIINYGTLLGLAYQNGNLIPTIFFMFVFFSLRGQTGGYHCKHTLSCYLCTWIIYMMIWIIPPLLLQSRYIIVTVSILSTMIILLVAPVNHPNLRLSNEEIFICRRFSRRITLLIITGIFISLWLNVIHVSVLYAATALAMDAGLLVIAKFIKQEVSG